LKPFWNKLTIVAERTLLTKISCDIRNIVCGTCVNYYKARKAILRIKCCINWG